MATPMAIAGMGMTIAGGLVGAKGAEVSAKGQQLGIQGQMMNTMAQIFGLQTQAQDYMYKSNIALYQKAVADFNTKIAEDNANYARATGEVAAQQSGMKAKADVASMTAHQAASGIDVSSRSAAGVRTSMTEIAQNNQDLIRASAAKQAYGFEVEATQDEAQSQLYQYTSDMEKTQASNALAAAQYAGQALPLQQQAWSLAGEAGDINALSSLLGAGSSVASKWSKANELKLFG